ncbi:unnamed protein product, partial [Prorocentrum cordatum]
MAGPPDWHLDGGEGTWSRASAAHPQLGLESTWGCLPAQAPDSPGAVMDAQGQAASLARAAASDCAPSPVRRVPRVQASDSEAAAPTPGHHPASAALDSAPTAPAWGARLPAAGADLGAQVAALDPAVADEGSLPSAATPAPPDGWSQPAATRARERSGSPAAAVALGAATPRAPSPEAIRTDGPGTGPPRACPLSPAAAPAPHTEQHHQRAFLRVAEVGAGDQPCQRSVSAGLCAPFSGSVAPGASAAPAAAHGTCAVEASPHSAEVDVFRELQRPPWSAAASSCSEGSGAFAAAEVAVATCAADYSARGAEIGAGGPTCWRFGSASDGAPLLDSATTGAFAVGEAAVGTWAEDAFTCSPKSDAGGRPRQHLASASDGALCLDPAAAGASAAECPSEGSLLSGAGADAGDWRGSAGGGQGACWRPISSGDGTLSLGSVGADATAAVAAPSIGPEGAAALAQQAPASGAERCFRVTFTRDAHKKRRSWEDGVLRVREGKGSLYSDDGKFIKLGLTLWVRRDLASGVQLKAGLVTLIEVGEEFPSEHFASGRAFAEAAAQQPAQPEAGPPSKRQRGRSLLCVSAGAQAMAPLEAAVVPPESLVLSGGGGAGPAFFVEPGIAQHLKPHQREGVAFMFKRVAAGEGCILADSMGLGKTLQALCLLWAALSQPAGRPLSSRAAVVCPSSLCGSWEAEVRQWLGALRLRPSVVQGGGPTGTAGLALDRFLAPDRPGGADCRLLIISYDQMRVHADAVDEAVDLWVFDEGHRLKARGIEGRRLDALRSKRRVLLTGTPLQNNLEEFWCCVNFVRPHLLPPPGAFQRLFRRPIERAQDTSASAEEVALGRARSAELARLTAAYILRRGPEVIESLLPPRAEILLTVPLTPPQVCVYRAMCRLQGADAACHAQSLSTLVLLRQLCNDPRDLLERCRGGAAEDAFANCDGEEPLWPAAEGTGILRLCREAFAQVDHRAWDTEEASGKLVLLEALLRRLGAEAPDEGIVIVSNFTSALARCRQACERLGFAAWSLQGSTQVAKRQELVESFNRQRGPKALMLSTKAGGVGLNITGASRLVMLEPDWNPAVDLQAMARVWRQGQRRPVFVYRLAMHGSLEENILRRQARKQGLARATVGASGPCCLQGGDWRELRRVFELSGYTCAGQPLPPRPGGAAAEAGADGEQDVPSGALLGGAEVRSILCRAVLMA